MKKYLFTVKIWKFTELLYNTQCTFETSEEAEAYKIGLFDAFRHTKEATGYELICINPDKDYKPIALESSKIAYLRRELRAESISYGELAEIDAAAKKLGIKVTDEMLAGDILDKIEELQTK